MGDIERAGVVVLRPELRRYGFWLARASVFLVPALAIYVGVAAARADSATALWLVIGLALGAVVAALVGVCTSILTTRVRLSPGQVEHRRWWVRSTVLDTSTPVEGVMAVHIVPSPRGEAAPLLVMRSGGDGPRIRLNGYFWTTQNLETIAAHAGITPTSEALDTAGFEAHAEHIMYWRERHVIWSGVVAALLITVAIVVVIFGALLAQGLPPFD